MGVRAPMHDWILVSKLSRDFPNRKGRNLNTQSTCSAVPDSEVARLLNPEFRCKRGENKFRAYHNTYGRRLQVHKEFLLSYSRSLGSVVYDGGQCGHKRYASRGALVIIELVLRD